MRIKPISARRFREQQAAVAATGDMSDAAIAAVRQLAATNTANGKFLRGFLSQDNKKRPARTKRRALK
jgi:hypothetical protein